MANKKPMEMPNSEDMDSASRRDFMKVAGIGALGLAYINPIVETLSGGTQLTNYKDRPQGGGSSSSGPSGSGSSSSWPSQSSLKSGETTV